MGSRTLTFFLLVSSLILSGCATMPNVGGDPFDDLRSTINRETASRPELQSSWIEMLNSADQAYRRGDAEETDMALTNLGGAVFDAGSNGTLTSEATIRILLSGQDSADNLVQRGFMSHYWTRMIPFPGRRCQNGQCRLVDPDWDCYLVTVCGEFKGCIARRVGVSP
jgi:hypothetical protein